MSNCFNPANILLPNNTVDMEKWSVIACDQFTSQADYWDAVEKYVGDAPSTLNVVFPEIYLGNTNSERIESINSMMQKDTLPPNKYSILLLVTFFLLYTYPSPFLICIELR